MKKKGFTLLEVLITALIFAIMGMGIMYFVANSNTIMKKSVKQAFAHTNAVYAMNLLAKDIREGAILECGTASVDGYSYNLKIRNPDGVTEHNWNYQYVPGTATTTHYYRIARDGVVVPFMGEISNKYNYVVFLFKTDMVGKYFYADIIFRMYVDGKYHDITTTSYCRHDPFGYFDPQDIISI